MATFIQNGGNNGGTYARYFSAILTVWEISNDIEKNTSNIGYKLELKSGSSGRFAGLSASYSVSINGGVVKTGNGTYSSQSYNTYQTICEGTLTVSHNDDGSKTIPCSASLDFQSHSASPGDFNPSGNFTLTTIPRASSISCSTTNIEENAVVTINSASPDFRHYVHAWFGNTHVDVKSGHVQPGGTFQWTIPASFYSEIPNRKSGTGVIICETYSGDTKIGEKNSNITITTNEERCKPSVNATLVDINQSTISLTEDDKKLILYKSTAKIDITATAKNSASVKTKKVNDATVTGNSISIKEIKTKSFEITVTDSRGYSNSITLAPEVIDYRPLTINAEIKRTQPTTGEIGITFSGNYYNGKFGTLDNTLSIKWYYREKNSGSWIEGGELEKTISENTYNNGKNVISLGKIYDYKKSYEFYLNVTDKLTTLKPTFLVAQGIPIINWGEDFFNVNGNILINEENINGTLLYENKTNETDFIILSKDVANFDYIEIFYHLHTSADGNIYSSTKAIKEGNVQLSLCRSVSDDTIQIYTKLVNVAGTLIKTVHSSYQSFSKGVNGSYGAGTDLAIDKVLGYKL